MNETDAEKISSLTGVGTMIGLVEKTTDGSARPVFNTPDELIKYLNFDGALKETTADILEKTKIMFNETIQTSNMKGKVTCTGVRLGLRNTITIAMFRYTDGGAIIQRKVVY